MQCVTWTTVDDGGANLKAFRRFVESSRATNGNRRRDTDIFKEMMSMINDTLSAQADVAKGDQANEDYFKGWEKHSDWDDTNFLM